MLRKFFALLALFSWIGVAHAGDKPLYQPAPDWVSPAPAIDATHLTDSDPALLVFDQQQRLKDGEVWAYLDTAARIVSPQMLTQSGTIPLPWDPSLGDLIIHRVEIIRGAEHIDLIAKGARFTVIQREQQLEQASLNGMLTATMAVEGLRVGDVLHLTMSITRKDPALHGHMQTIAPVIAAPVRMQFGRLRLLWPKTVDLHTRAYLKDVALTPVDRPDGYRELVVSLPVAKPAEMPSDAPQRYQPLPFVDATSYADWTDVSKDVAPLFATDGLIAPGSPLAAEVARIAAVSSDPRTRAAMALQSVQDKVRYLFRGMDDGNYVPQPPAKTWEVRYGDCKAKTLLLLSMLRALGINAEATLANVGASDIVSVRLPMPGAFNHVLVRATIGNDVLWLDGTGGGARAADLADVPPFRNVLPLRPGGAPLLAIPMGAGGRPDSDVNLEIDSTAGVSLPAPYKIRIVYRGGQAEMLRTATAAASKSDIDKLIDTTISQFMPQTTTVDRKLSYDEATGTALITASGVVYSDWSEDNDRIRFAIDRTIANLTFAPDRSRPAWRDIPVSSGDPSDKHMVTRIHLPDNGAGFTLEGDKTLPAQLAGQQLSRSVSLADGWITLDERVIAGRAEVAPADIPAARAQVALAKTRLLTAVAPAGYPALRKQVEPARRAKRLDPILAVYAKQIADAPDETSSYTERAWFLEQIYDRQGAIRDLGKALSIEASTDNYLWRARLYEAVNDDAHAIADVKSALESDPGSVAAVNQLAGLYARNGKLDDALATLAEHMDAGGKDKGAYASERAELLTEAGRAPEAVALLDTEIAAKPGDPSLLNSRCWAKGTGNLQLDTALKDCTKSIELSENPQNALDSRAMVYFRLGRMDEAMADLDAALDASPDQAASLFMRGVIGKRTGAKGADEDLAAARTIAPRIDEDYARYGIKP